MSMIRFNCPNCQKRLKAYEDQAGLVVLCSGCHQSISVPHIDGRAAPPAGGVSADGQARKPAPPPAAPPRPSEAAREEEPPPVLAKRPIPDEEIDMTPMIDMTFLLLIFFMVTASFLPQKSIEMPPPDAEQAAKQTRERDPEEEDDNIVVRIESDNTIYVNDQEAPTRHEVLALMREGLGSGSGGPNSLLVKASGEAHHEAVVMVLDCGTVSGMESIRLTSLGEDE